MFNTIDYIRGIVESMTFTQSLSNINTATAGETTFDTCKTYWAFPDLEIIINAVKYEVKDFELNKSITIRGVLTGTETEYTIEAPNFFHGTPIQTAIELGMEKYWRNKLPFIYFIEPFTETRDLSPLRVLDRKSELNLLFMLPGELEDSVGSQYQTAIKPADNMVFEWEKKILTDPNIGELDKAKSRNRVNYGVWVSKSGKPKTSKEDNIMKLLNEAISGIEYAITIPFKRKVCDIDNLCKK